MAIEDVVNSTCNFGKVFGASIDLLGLCLARHGFGFVEYLATLVQSVGALSSTYLFS